MIVRRSLLLTIISPVRGSVRCMKSEVDLSKVVKVAELDQETHQLFKNGLKVKKSPGKRKTPACYLPTHLEKAALSIIKKYRSRSYVHDVKEMQNRIYHFPLPPEQGEVQVMAKEVEAREIARDERNHCNVNEEQMKEIEDMRKKRVLSVLRNRIYGWKEMRLTEYQGVVYLGARLAPNYATLSQIFKEIKLADPTFQPKTLFDFGSGIGTTMWAANECWPKSINEHFNVDCNQHLNDLSLLLLKCGDDKQPPLYNNVFYRQFLPISHDIKYDLVVSAFSLKDLPNFQSRVNAIENLWYKTQDTLVIVEHGNRDGFSAVLEARNLILKMSGFDPTAIYRTGGNTSSEELTMNISRPQAHIVAPCPHHYSCPRLQNKFIRCNFPVKYWPIDFGQVNYMVDDEHYSYIVFRKAPKLPSDAPSWPRIVEPVIKNKGNTICRVCAADGQLHEIAVSKSKHDKLTFKCAKASHWGDLLPIQVKELTKEELRRTIQEKKKDKM